MEWLLYVVAVIFFLLGAACTVLVVFQLPGSWILLGIALLIEWLDRYYLPAGSRQTFDWWVLGASLVLLIIGEIIEFVAGAVGARKGGSSRRGMWGALIGGFNGTGNGLVGQLDEVGLWDRALTPRVGRPSSRSGSTGADVRSFLIQ